MNPWKEKREIGNATLYLGDCLEILKEFHGLGDGCQNPDVSVEQGRGAGNDLKTRIDAVITDPPWRASDGSRLNRRPGDGLGVAPSRTSTSLRYGSIGVFDKNVISLFPEIARADILVLCGYMELGEVIDALKPVRGIFVWKNTRPTPIPGAVMARDVAHIVWGGKSTNAGENGQRWRSCLFEHASPQAGCMATERLLNSDGSTAHPAQEPLALFEALVRPVSGVVLDPYLGTGTTGVACMNLGRKFIGIEIEPKYYEIACERIENAQRQQRMFA